MGAQAADPGIREEISPRAPDDVVVRGVVIATLSVRMASTPTFRLLAARPDMRAPTSTGTGVPAALKPMRRLKNGTRFPPGPNEKTFVFSRKNSRFSGKNRLKRVRLTCC